MKIRCNNYDVVLMAEWLKVTPQGYYNHLKSLEKPYKYATLLAKMEEIM